MARRYDQLYRVKARDNLGDPEYWNQRFEDLDRRINSNEDGLAAIGGLTSYVEGLALNRLDLVLAPALDKIALVSEQGFLLAHANNSVTLNVATTQTFAIPDEAERDLFAPSPFVTIVRQANTTDYAFAKLVNWNRSSGQLTLQPIQTFGNAGPFSDWIIYVGTALPQVVTQTLMDAQAARDAAKGYRDTASTYATQTGQDKSAVAQMKSDALAARDQCATYAANAQIFDPSFYIKKDVGGTFSASVNFTVSPTVPTVTAGDNSLKAASTAYVKNAIDALVNGAPGTLDTLKEIADQLASDESAVGALTASVAGKLQKDQNLADVPNKAAALTNLGISFATPTGAATTNASAGTATTYMRSDASIKLDMSIQPTWTGKHIHQFSSGQTYGFNHNTYGGLTVYAPDLGAAFVTYHRGAYAVQAGLDGDNWWRIGGWSDGANWRFGVSGVGDGYLRGSLGVGTFASTQSGSIVATGDVVYGASDIRLKDEIQVIEDALEKVKKLRGVTWIQSDLAKEVGAPEQKFRKAGLLAQELREVLPEAVGIAPFDRDEDGNSKSGSEFLNIFYEQVTGLLVEAIKSLATRVEGLEGA
ncbi:MULTISPECIES: tail fiber domain-containing protein [unclassified Bradyrhizobium]|uniref:tail fiber domain-containing protein n=1 Tax=unclassified Bradyrhizobium TaxID=2631580 RepID=UPI0028EF74CD|nr:MULTISPECIES: tail fiber domain-containing protein [unclassified Bradyrhizobium]